MFVTGDAIDATCVIGVHSHGFQGYGAFVEAIGHAAHYRGTAVRLRCYLLRCRLNPYSECERCGTSLYDGIYDHPCLLVGWVMFLPELWRWPLRKIIGSDTGGAMTSGAVLKTAQITGYRFEVVLDFFGGRECDIKPSPLWVMPCPPRFLRPGGIRTRKCWFTKPAVTPITPARENY